MIELSSFQIDLTPSLDPSVGVLLNLTPDHLDRHGTFAQYAAIKERLIAGSDVAIIGIDDGPSRAIAERRGDRLVRIHVPRDAALTAAALTVRDGVVRDQAGEAIADVAAVRALRGAHNWQNAAVAVAVAQALGLDGAAIQAGLDAFPGLPHRMEAVRVRGRVLFVNDSKATNADSTEKALTAFRDIHWILGGKAKDGGIFPLAPCFERIAHAYLIGAASDAFAATLEGAVPYTRCGTLDVATRAAAAGAEASGAAEPVVLLSPACASYDQFRSFEQRGDAFRDIVRALD